jgi:hypothetical protein
VESKSSWTWTPPWCGCPSSSSLSPWPSPSPFWSSPLFLINNTCMEASVSFEKQLTRLEHTWRSNCRARALVIGPCIVCKGEMSSSVSNSNDGPFARAISLHVAKSLAAVALDVGCVTSGSVSLCCNTSRRL